MPDPVNPYESPKSDPAPPSHVRYADWVVRLFWSVACFLIIGVAGMAIPFLSLAILVGWGVISNHRSNSTSADLFLVQVVFTVLVSMIGGAFAGALRKGNWGLAYTFLLCAVCDPLFAAGFWGSRNWAELWPVFALSMTTKVIITLWLFWRARQPIDVGNGNDKESGEP